MCDTYLVDHGFKLCQPSDLNICSHIKYQIPIHLETINSGPQVGVKTATHGVCTVCMLKPPGDSPGYIDHMVSVLDKG